jgi:hypothetical protein
LLQYTFRRKQHAILLKAERRVMRTVQIIAAIVGLVLVLV